MESDVATTGIDEDCCGGCVLCVTSAINYMYW